MDLTDAAHTARRRHVFPIDAFGGQGGNLQERGARVQQQVDTFTDRQLAALAQALLGGFATAVGDVVQFFLQLLAQCQVVFPIGLKFRAGGIDLTVDLGHGI